MVRVLWRTGTAHRDDAEGRLLLDVFRALSGLATLQTAKDSEPAVIIESGTAFYNLARELDRRKGNETAMACAQSAANMLSAVENPAAEASSRLALDLARRIPNLDAVAGERARLGVILTKIAQTDASRRLEAFDALEAAFRYFTTGHRPAENFLQLFSRWMGTEPWLKTLGLLFWAGLPPAIRKDKPEEFAKVARALGPIWQGPFVEFY